MKNNRKNRKLIQIRLKNYVMRMHRQLNRSNGEIVWDQVTYNVPVHRVVFKGIILE